jgi:hypothetical protein
VIPRKSREITRYNANVTHHLFVVTVSGGVAKQNTTSGDPTLSYYHMKGTSMSTEENQALGTVDSEHERVIASLALHDLSSRISDLGGTWFTLRPHLRLDDESVDNIELILELSAGYVTELEISGDDWRDRHIREIQRELQDRTGITTLEIRICERLTDEALLHVSKIESLQTVDLSRLFSKKLSRTGFLMLQRLPNLELLRLPTTLRLSEDDVFGRETDALIAELQSMMPNTIIKKG